MQTLIGDAKLAESHVRNAASFSHRSGTAKANRIAVKSASIHLVQDVRRRGLVSLSTFTTVGLSGIARNANLPEVQGNAKAIQISNANNANRTPGRIFLQMLLFCTDPVRVLLLCHDCFCC